jgi:hypothetical protein
LGGLNEELPHISNAAVKKLLPYPSACLCETAFSRFAAIRNEMHK